MLKQIKDFMTGEMDSKSPKKPKKEKGGDETVQLELQQLKVELEESKDKYLRLFAEFDNYKKRTVKERFELMKTAAQETIVSLLPVLDDFDRAKKSADDPNSPEVFSEGVSLVYHKLYTTLQHKGLVEMESTNQDFDAERHEAITDIPAPSEDLKGKVIDTIEKGYLLHDKIIRYAKVVVGK
ncbi:MAG: nucleotide exchange factor GrpE [Saprospiraceae bacterium]|nr:nucleotide exchange factor GrpE [Saprospiraceae bacterium]MBK6564241.1 nucleotide exchange factor GrpE [Saprospiraceae bacterium]MBK6782405.1 nucleotide exchange factor GrpE [Saprospiraceae bacterium]MBK7524078.1 nucleotide exchange factor GrpE [Saprospiraceae bacterium]MBK8372131.1 nucleotide exchange factor GrpE [Saprospiraceae bacterium]